ncbi:MAG: hypothetical protein B7X02_00255 [Rhodospirillales bacterium 12-54-5]|nr:MAG: hypothetical protein B7X02_00255 [Rhodospirillales bacterium 12-54-5]
MTNDLIPPSDRFARAVAKVQAKRVAEGLVPIQTASPVAPKAGPSTGRSPKARLNFFPDDSYLSDMVEKALTALSRGVVWARGAIVNLVV